MVSSANQHHPENKPSLDESSNLMAREPVTALDSPADGLTPPPLPLTSSHRFLGTHRSQIHV